MTTSREHNIIQTRVLKYAEVSDWIMSSLQEAMQRRELDTLFATEWSIDQLNQTILQLAVMGKLAPQGPIDEPVSDLVDQVVTERDRLKEEEGMGTAASAESWVPKVRINSFQTIQLQLTDAS